ncbi:hypothetical protein HH214_03930 [Mucilaginibacter robiniae]|uniref:Uncharacterized protein n=1 Tax=Mucilaginibacter robiniae TaxID=2728022 RepID=A0A7L5DVE7_9SPHI|nr:hypothetical protein [Mucilaginibacter robiniae]QJD95085.1 hypothetical protein HH214_03930 [Mucilaginibacter robiniae]
MVQIIWVKFMKKVGCLVWILLLGYGALAQKKANLARLDVDRLYEIYHDKQEVTFRTNTGNVTANVLIYYNAYRQPCAIILYGDAVGLANIEEVKQQLGAAKLHDGYVKDNGKLNTIDFDRPGAYENNVEVTVYHKGTQYAKYGIKKMEERNPVDTLNNDNMPTNISDFFYFEVGDTARKQAIRPGKLVF